MGILKTESYRRGAIYSTFLNLFAKGIGFINSLLVIYIFGSGLDTDFFYLVLATVTLITSFINGIDLLILVPEAMRLRYNTGVNAEMGFLNFFIRAYALIGLAISLVIFLGPALFYSLFSQFGVASLQQRNQMLYFSAFLFPIQLLNSLFISILTSHKYFIVPMVSALVNSIVSIILLLALNKQFAITGAVIAMLSGYVVNFIWLTLYMKKELSWGFFNRALSPAKTIRHNILLLQLNILPVSFRTYITTLLISGLGTGVITAYNYGQQISLLPHALIATQLVAVAGVKLNELSSKQDNGELDSFTNRFLRFLYIILFPLAAIMALTSREVVGLFFGHSAKIDKTTLDNIALIIFFMSLTLPNLALDLTLTRLVMAQQKIRQSVLYGIITHIVFVILVFTGIRLFGLKGFLIAYFIGNNIFLPALYYLLLKKTAPFIKYLDWVRSSLGFVFFNILLIVGIWFAKQSLPASMPLLTIAVVVLLYTSALLLFNRMFNYYQPLNQYLNKLLPAK